MKQKLQNLPNEKKKVVITIVYYIEILFFILAVISAACLELQLVSNDKFWIFEILLATNLVLTIVWSYVVDNISDYVKYDDRTGKTISFFIKPASYLSFKESFEKFISKKNYTDVFLMDNILNCDVHCYMQHHLRSCKICVIINLSEQLLTDEFSKQYLEVIVEKLVDKYPNILKKTTYFTHILCVSKPNEVSRKITNRSAEQQMKFYQLPIVFSVSNQQMYIAPLKYDFGKKYYKKMLKEIKEYINKQSM